MSKKDNEIEPIDDSFDSVTKAVISSKNPLKEIAFQPSLDLGIEIEREVNGIGMGVLGDGTPYLNQRGLAALCGVQNAHIGTISSQWNEDLLKPKVTSIKNVLQKVGYFANTAHIEIYSALLLSC